MHQKKLKNLFVFSITTITLGGLFLSSAFSSKSILNDPNVSIANLTNKATSSSEYTFDTTTKNIKRTYAGVISPYESYARSYNQTAGTKTDGGIKGVFLYNNNLLSDVVDNSTNWNNYIKTGNSYNNWSGINGYVTDTTMVGTNNTANYIYGISASNGGWKIAPFRNNLKLMVTPYERNTFIPLYSQFIYKKDVEDDNVLDDVTFIWDINKKIFGDGGSNRDYLNLDVIKKEYPDINDKRIEGVVIALLPFNRSINGASITNGNYNQIQLWNQNTLRVDTLQYYQQNNIFESFAEIPNKNSQWFNTNLADLRYGLDGTGFMLGFYDDKIWYASQEDQQDIKIKLKDDLITKTTYNQFKADIQNGDINSLFKYVDLEVFNAPDFVINGNSSENSKIQIDFDDIQGNVTITVTTPRSFKPSYDSDMLVNPSNYLSKLDDFDWIKDDDFTKTISISNFKNSSTCINSTLSDSQGNYNYANQLTMSAIDWTEEASIKSSLINNMVYSWSNLFDNLPTSIKPDNFVIELDMSQTKPADGIAVISKLSLNKYYDKLGTLTTTGTLDLINTSKVLKITNLNRAITTINWDNTNISNQSNYITWNVTNDLSNTSTLPSEFRKDTTKLISFNELNKLFKNLPSEFTDADYNISEVNRDDSNGIITFKIKLLKNYVNNIGNLATVESQTYDIKLTGFNLALSWLDSLKQTSGYEYNVPNESYLQKIYFNSITVDQLKEYITQNYALFFPSWKNNYSLNDFNITHNSSEGSITIDGAVLNDGTNNYSLPSLKLKNFIFASINLTPKATIDIGSDMDANYDLANMYAPQVVESIVNNKNQQANLIKILTKLYDGIDTLDANVYEIQIDQTKLKAYASTGSLNLEFSILNKNANNTISFTHNFILPKQGITQLLKNQYFDTTFDSTAIMAKLQDNSEAKAYLQTLANNNIINAFIAGIGIEVTPTLNPNKSISVQISVKDKYVNETDLGSVLKPLGTLTIYGTDTAHLNNVATIVVANGNFASNLLFSNIQTANEFKQLLDANLSNKTYIDALIATTNVPSTSIITITSINIVNTNNVEVTFSFSEVQDENGNVSGPKTYTFTYYLLPQNNATIINPYVQITNSNKYAYQYIDTDDLKNLDNIIVNPAIGYEKPTNITIKQVNNKLGTIVATVSVDQSINSLGNNGGRLEQEVIFYNAKAATSYSTIQRNDVVDISESYDVFKKALDDIKNNTVDASNAKNIISKYINVSTLNSEWTIKSYTEASGKIGIFDVSFQFINNYFNNDDTYSFISDGSVLMDNIPATIRFATIPTLTTRFNQNIVQTQVNNSFYYQPNFLEVADNNQNVTSVVDISDDKIKTLIPSLLENNPGLSASQITYNRIDKANDNEIILRNVKLARYYDGNGSIPVEDNSNWFDIGTLVLKIKLTPNTTDTITLDPNTIPTTYDTFIDVQALGLDQYASQLAYNFIKGDEQINQAAIKAVQTKFLYYNDNQKVSNLKVSDIKIKGATGVSGSLGGLSDAQYWDFIKTGTLPNDAVNNASINAVNGTIDYNNLTLQANLSYTKDGTIQNSTVNIGFYNTKTASVPATDIAAKTTFSANELQYSLINEVNSTNLATNLLTYYNNGYEPTNPPLSVVINDFNVVNNEIKANITIKNYVYNKASTGNPIVIIYDKNLTITINSFTNNDVDLTKTTTLKKKIEYTTTLEVTALSLSDNQIKEELLTALGDGSSYFENLPASIGTSTNDVIIKEKVINGNTISVSFYLTKYYLYGKEVTNDIKNPTGPLFEATLKGYKKVNGLKDLNTNLDLTNQQFNDTTTVDGILTNGVDFTTLIKNEMIKYIDTNKPFDDTKNTQIKDYLTNTFNISATPEYKVNANKVAGTIKVKDNQLATLTGDNAWNDGVTFTFNNANWAKTTVSIADASLTKNITFDSFKTNPSQIKATDLFNVTNLVPNKTNITLKAASNGDNKQGIGQIIIVFESFYTESGKVDNYEYLVDNNFIFQPEDSNTLSKDVLVDTIVHTNSSENIYSLYNKLNDTNNKTVIDQELAKEATKKKLLQTQYQTDVSKYTLTFVNATTIDNTYDALIMTLLVNNQVYESITITGLSAIVPTQFTIADILPQISVDDMKTYFDGLSGTQLTTKVKQFITWNDQTLPDGQSTTPTKVEVFGFSGNSCYVNFTFNGIFNANKQYETNYLVQIKVSNLSTHNLNSDSVVVEFVDLTNSTPTTPTKHQFNYLLIIFIILIVGMFSLISCKLWINRKKKKEAENK